MGFLWRMYREFTEFTAARIFEQNLAKSLFVFFFSFSVRVISFVLNFVQSSSSSSSSNSSSRCLVDLVHLIIVCKAKKYF